MKDQYQVQCPNYKHWFVMNQRQSVHSSGHQSGSLSWFFKSERFSSSCNLSQMFHMIQLHCFYFKFLKIRCSYLLDDSTRDNVLHCSLFENFPAVSAGLLAILVLEGLVLNGAHVFLRDIFRLKLTPVTAVVRRG